MRTDLLLRHADFLDNLPVDRFDFSTVRDDEPCGTVACAIGWLPESFPEIVRYNAYNCCFYVNGTQWDSCDYEFAGGDLFEMDAYHARNLFAPNCQSYIGLENVDDEATPQQVATLIRQYCEKYGTTSTEPK